MEKENDLILKKIIDVNRRGSTNSIQARTTSHTNLHNLKKSLQKTNEENMKFANKLISTTSKLNQRFLNE
jgi:hypothetical protein